MSGISRVRRVPGNDRVEQTRRLPRKVGDRYRLGDEVGTDWMQFLHLVGSVRPDGSGLDGLIEAFGLVRGIPLLDVQTLIQGSVSMLTDGRCERVVFVCE